MDGVRGGKGPSSKRRTLFGYGMAAVMTTAGIATLASGHQEPQPQPGLRGILPTQVPTGLTDEDFSVLGGNWEQWAQEVAKLLQQFYTDDSLDLNGQRTLLRQLHARLTVMEEALRDERYRSIFVPLTTLHGRLERRVALADAALDTLQTDPRTVQSFQQSAATDVLRALDALQGWLNTVPNGNAWLPYVQADEIRRALGQGGEPRQAVPVLESVQDRLRVNNRPLADDQKKFLSRQPFADLRRAVGHYLAISRADQPESRQQLRDALAQLMQAVEGYEETHGAEPAAGVRAAFDRLRAIAPDGGLRISSALQNEYMNYNFRVVLSEGFVNRLMASSSQQQGPVTDCILGAAVSGYQWTTSQVNVDVQPSSNTARFALGLTGTTQSSTQGVTSQATVYTSGLANFYATKDVQYNGLAFTSSPAQISVGVNNTTTGIRTRFSGVPILRGIANRIASRQVQARRPETDAIARSRVSDRVLPELNSTVESRFADLTQRIDRELYQGLRDTGLYPDVMKYSSTDDAARISTRLMSPGELGANTPESVFAPATGATVMLHESLLNNAADRLRFAGRTMTDEQVRQELESFLSRALNRKVDLFSDRPPVSDEDRGPNMFVFAPADPIRFAIADETVSLILRTGFRQEGREDIPLHEVTVELKPSALPDRILIQRGQIRVAPLERVGGAAQRVAQAGIIRRKIETSIPERSVDPNYNIQAEGRIIPVRMTRIDALDGWLRLTFE